MTEDDQDRECVRRCLEGWTEQFAAIVDRYQRPLYNVIFHMVGDREDARELCQQVFMKCYEHLGEYDPARRFFSWIYRTAVNESINHLKARRPTESYRPAMIDTAPGPDVRFEAVEQQARLRRAIESLEPKYRTVIVLRHFLHLSYHEASEVLDLPEKTVKSRLFTARQLLRDLLTENERAAAR